MTKQKEKPEEVVRFTLRINKDLFEATRKSAIHNRRATGKEIEFVLFEYYKKLKIIKQN